jgi:hypothetical protein
LGWGEADVDDCWCFLLLVSEWNGDGNVGKVRAGEDGRSYSGRRRAWISLATSGLAPRVARGMAVLEDMIVVRVRVVGFVFAEKWEEMCASRGDGLHLSAREAEERTVFMDAMRTENDLVSFLVLVVVARIREKDLEAISCGSGVSWWWCTAMSLN